MLTDHNRNLPIGGAAILLLLLFLRIKRTQDEASKLPLLTKILNLDPAGVILLLGTICCLLLALQWGGSHFAWNSAKVIGLLICFVVLLFLFCIVQWKLEDRATIPLRLLRQRSVSFGAVSLFFISFSTHIVSLSLFSIC